MAATVCPLSRYKPPIFTGTIVTPRGLRLLNRVRIPAQIAEVRVDALLAGGVSAQAIELALIKRAHPALLTLRIPAEGGQYAWRGKQREELFLRLLPHVELIDIELASVVPMKRVIAAARAAGKSIILSAHSLRKPLDSAALKKLTAAFLKQSASCYKIAAQVRSQDDVRKLASLLFHHPGHPWAIMGVGPLAAHTRLMFAVLGSRLAYGYLDAPAAPGQPSVVALAKLLAPFTHGSAQTR